MNCSRKGEGEDKGIESDSKPFGTDESGSFWTKYFFHNLSKVFKIFSPFSEMKTSSSPTFISNLLRLY